MARFQSKVDTWLVVLLAAVVAVQLFVLANLLVADVPATTKVFGVAVISCVVLLVGSVLFRTHYTILDGELRIVSGPFGWTISIADITGFTESRNPLSSPALSLDRLKVSYGRNKSILISPADKVTFLKAVGHDTP